MNNQKYFENTKKAGFTQENPDYLNLHYQLGQRIINSYCPRSFVEIGPGPGALLEFMLSKGINCRGYDISQYFKKYFNDRNPGFFGKYLTIPAEKINIFDIKINLAVPIIDMVAAIEVFEHLTKETCTRLIEQMAPHVRFVYFSSTPHKTDQDKDIGHQNVLSSTEWEEMFIKAGFMLFEKPQQPTLWSMVFKSKIL